MPSAVPSAVPVSGNRLGSVPRTAEQTRILAAALELFAAHGVSGTSLQMIADAAGMAKAAVYYRFKTKEEIVIATAEMGLAKLEAALETAEAEQSRPRARVVLLAQVINLAVAGRHLTSTLERDPVIVRLLAEHEPFQQLINRVYGLLIGNDAGPEARVPASMLAGAIGGACAHPLVADLDDDTLRYHLLLLTQRLLDLPG